MFFIILQFVESGLSEKILHQARKQQRELEEETSEVPEIQLNQILEHDNESSDEEEAEHRKDEETDFYENIVIVL